MFELFQTATGQPHWPSIITGAATTIAFVAMVLSLIVNRRDRIRAYEKDVALIASTSQSKLRLDDLLMRSGPRTVTSEAKSALLREFGKVPKGTLILAVNIESAEAREFGGQLEALLREAGFDVDVKSFAGGPSSSERSLFLSNADLPEVDINDSSLSPIKELKESFDRMGYPFDCIYEGNRWGGYPSITIYAKPHPPR